MGRREGRVGHGHGEGAEGHGCHGEGRKEGRKGEERKGIRKGWIGAGEVFGEADDAVVAPPFLYPRLGFLIGPV